MKDQNDRVVTILTSISVLVGCIAVLVLVIGAVVGYDTYAITVGRNERNEFQVEQRAILCAHVNYVSPYCDGTKGRQPNH